MAKRKIMRIQFPLGGLDRKASYRQSRPYTTLDCMNVRPVGTLENRERGGSRPALINSHLDSLGSEIRFLAPMILAPGDGFTSWSDTFAGSSLAAAWTQASWASDVPNILQMMAAVDTDTAEGEVVLDALPIDSAQPYTVEMFIAPWAGAHHGEYRLYLRMDNTTPDIEDEGVWVNLVLTGSGGTYSGTLKSLTGGVTTSYALASGNITSARPGWLSITVSGDTVTVYWNGITLKSQVIPTSHTGLRVGFGMKCTVADGLCLANVFRVQYYSTGNVDALRTMLVGSAGGDIYKEGPYGRMTVITSDLTVRNDTSLNAVQSGQDLYIADYGDLRITQTDGIVTGTALTATVNPTWNALGILTDDDVVVISNVGGATVAGTYKIASVAAGSLTLASAPGDGTCAFRIERAPKICDPVAETIAILTATAGQVPTGCPLTCRYLNRIMLAGAEIAPNVWYAARQGTETDWDYSQEDNQRAVAGTSSEAGVPGEAITALVPHSDDYLIIGCRNELHRMRGDPAYGGELDALSHTIGIVGMNAWCWGPAAELIFLSLDGIYILPPGGDSRPISMSREVLPQELLNFDPNTTTVLLEYDIQDRGVHIYLTPDSSNVRTHWWFDWDRKTFWPLTLAAAHEPFATCALQATAIEDSAVILGGRDGTLRRPSGLAETDCGTAFSTYVNIGPIPLAQDGLVGSLMSLEAVIAEDSGNITWGVYPALTFEATATASAAVTGTWVAGLNTVVHPAGRGQAYLLRLTGASGRRWAFEQAIAVVRDSGRRRKA